MHATNLICLLASVCSFYDVTVGRSTSMLPYDLTIGSLQSDDTNTIQDAMDTLGDVKLATNKTLNLMCSTFCRAHLQSSSCCQVAALSYSHLSSTSLINTGSQESQLSSVVRVSGAYEKDVEQMAVTAQRRECHHYWQQNRECPLSRDQCETEQSLDTQYCQLKRLGSDISSFTLIVRQMMVSGGYPVPSAPTPTPNDDVINDVTRQDQRDLSVLAMAASDWGKILNILNTLNES